MKARAIASIVAVGLVAAGVAGCTYLTPIGTQQIDDVVDGANVSVGDVKLLGAVVVSENGKDGNLVATAYNASDRRVDLTLQYDVVGKHTIDVELEPNSSTPLGFGEAGQVLLPRIGTKPGGLLPLYVQYGDEQGKQVKVPVLTNAEEQYSTLTPTPLPKPTPTTSPTPTGSATPSGPDQPGNPTPGTTPAP